MFAVVVNELLYFDLYTFLQREVKIVPKFYLCFPFLFYFIYLLIFLNIYVDLFYSHLK